MYDQKASASTIKTSSAGSASVGFCKASVASPPFNANQTCVSGVNFSAGNHLSVQQQPRQNSAPPNISQQQQHFMHVHPHRQLEPCLHKGDPSQIAQKPPPDRHRVVAFGRDRLTSFDYMLLGNAPGSYGGDGPQQMQQQQRYHPPVASGTSGLNRYKEQQPKTKATMQQNLLPELGSMMMAASTTIGSSGGDFFGGDPTGFFTQPNLESPSVPVQQVPFQAQQPPHWQGGGLHQYQPPNIQQQSFHHDQQVQLHQHQLLCKKNLHKMLGISPSDIDKYSRIFFPVTFICFNLMYWIIYLHVSDEIAEELVLLHDA